MTDDHATELPLVDLEILAKAISEASEGKAASISFFDLFPPFTLVCAVLCILFGSLGLFGAASTTPGFLDIAKIFAGALVGSTASVALTSDRMRRGR